MEDESALLPQSVVSSPSLFSMEPPIVITNCQQLKLRTFAVIGGLVLTSPEPQGHEDTFSPHQGHRVTYGGRNDCQCHQVTPEEGQGTQGVSSSQTQKTDLNRNPRRASTLHACYIRKLDFTGFFRDIEKKTSGLQTILISN